jgi:hypothetical protein
MKTICLTALIAVFLLFCLNGVQAQYTETKLNQVELFKQWIGTWKSDNAKDTTAFWDAKSYGTGLDFNNGYKRYHLTEHFDTTLLHC